MYQFPEELKTAYESSPLSMVYYQNIDDRPVPVLVSDGFCRNTGMKRENVLEWLKRGLFERMHPDDVGMVSQISDNFLHRKGPYNVVFRCRLESSPSKPGAETEEVQYLPIHGIGKWQTMPDGTELAVISYCNLLETQKAAKENLEFYELSGKDRFYTDPITGLPNLNYLNEFGEEKINLLRAEGKLPCVIYIDIYAMQSYNNRYGFQEGNELLHLTAEALKKRFPKSLVTRATDDHFILISWADDRVEVEKRMREVNKTIRSSAKGNTSGIRSGVCPVEEGLSLHAALDHAKRALRRIANDMNREVAFFSKEADEVYLLDRYIVENFDLALEKGWIKAYYHELYRVENQKVSAFECLARWVDPKYGVIAPGAFIPVLLRYHQLYKLDLYMFEQVCRDVKRRHENGLPPMPVSVNFSRQDFDHADIVKEMNRIYDQYHLSDYLEKSYFIVEITEQDLAVGTERLREQLKEIRENHYGLWLDDFGSGYSSINAFSRFEFDLIKFDMDLLRRLDDNGGVNRLILRGLVTLARKIGIHALIEGLETEDQLDFVKEIGCELAQGFYYCKPESLDEILLHAKDVDIIKRYETPEERAALSDKWLSDLGLQGESTAEQKADF